MACSFRRWTFGAEPPTLRNIVHAGAMYGDRSFVPVLRAFAAIAREDARFRDVRLIQYGELLPQERRVIEAENLQHLLVEKSRITRESLWSILRAAQGAACSFRAGNELFSPV